MLVAWAQAVEDGLHRAGRRPAEWQSAGEVKSCPAETAQQVCTDQQSQCRRQQISGPGPDCSCNSKTLFAERCRLELTAYSLRGVMERGPETAVPRFPHADRDHSSHQPSERSHSSSPSVFNTV